MRILLDTHVLLWMATGSSKLKSAARRLIDDPANDLTFSAVSIWEIAIKNSLGQASFSVDLTAFHKGLFAIGVTELPISSIHAAATEQLPTRHKDPFDRMLIAQAITEGMTLLTADKDVAAYKGPVRKI